MDKQFYADAASEVARGILDEALFIKAMALAGGEESRARALYINLRAEEIAQAHRLRDRSRQVQAASAVVGSALSSVTRFPFEALACSILSLIFPGAGQWAAGRAGAKFFFPWLCLVWVVASNLAAESFLGLIAAFLLFALHVYAAAEAFVGAERKRKLAGY